MIRYAPYIDGTIPAFTDEAGIVVPFTPNNAVGEDAAAGMVLKISNLDGSLVGYLEVDKDNIDWENNISIFNFSDGVLGQYYKLQLAYYDVIPVNEKGEKQYNKLTYSTVGITKYIGSEATLKITSISSIGLKFKYECNDNTEILDKYVLEVYENNASSDLIYTQSDSFKQNNEITFIYPLLNGKDYSVTLKGNTINNYSLLDTSTYFKENNNEEIPFPILEENNKNYEYGENNFNKDNQYRLIRALNKSPSFYSIVNNPDNTIESGKEYYYGLINDNGDWSLNEASTITYFEDMFLQDATHTLRIKFNPKISNFKTNIPDSKQETLGSRFPFFFRNGDAYYNEFPISGLISYHMNGNGKFMNDNELGLVENSGERSNTNSTGAIEDKLRTTNLTDYNIAAERKFKLAVLEWLNNGQPKLFRSPTEGNFIVRLMNVSLTPEERLGRMLHTFNATAIEVSNDINIVYKETFIKVGNEIINQTISLEDLDARYVSKAEFASNIDEAIDIVIAGGSEG